MTSKFPRIQRWMRNIFQVAAAFSHRITGRFQVEKALRESEEKFRNLFECAKDAIVLADAQSGIIIDVNPAATRLLGLPGEKMVGKHQSLLHPPEKAEHYKQVFRDHVEKGLVLDEDILLQRADGTIITADISASVFQLGGRPVIQGVFRNITERKQMEEALSNEAIWRRILIKESRDGIVILDRNGAVFEANQRYAGMLGYSPEEMAKLHVWDWDTQWTPEQLLDMLNTVDEAGDHFETHQQRKDGTIVDVEVSTNGATFAGQKLVFCVCRDITERNKMANLQKAENQVLTLLAQGEEIDKLLDALVRLCEQNDPAVKGSVMLYDASKNWLTGSGPSLSEEYNAVLKIGVPAAPDMGSCGTAAYLKQRVVVTDIKNSPLFKPHQGAVELATRHGLLACWSEPIISSGGYLLGTIANYSDHLGEPNADNLRVLEWSARIAAIAIERKQIEKALRESEEKFAIAFRASPDSISIIRAKDGVFIEVNDSYLYFTGFSREELIGHRTSEFMLWADEVERERVLDKIKKQGSVQNEEVRLLTRTGEVKICLISASHITISREPCMISVATDITVQKQSEDKLKHAMADLERSSAQLQATNKELESFSYSVSHDLRSPLRSIDGFSQALLEDYADKLDETGQDYLQRLRNASQKMGELIDGLLKISRLTRSEMHREETDLSLLAGEIAARLNESSPERRVIFAIGSGLTANGDPQMLRVLLENLLGNAFKFTLKTPRARIEFGCQANGEKKTFFIKDNGAGFDMAYKDRLFGAFQRLHDTADFPGTGIGLATVQRIVNRHGGSIRAEGGIGQGATFYFTLN